MTNSTINENTINLIYSVIDDVNRLLPREGRLDKSKETILLGQGGGLDSLGQVNFLVTLEQKIEESHSLTLDLADAAANTSIQSSFKTVGALSDYLTSYIKEQGNASVHI